MNNAMGVFNLEALKHHHVVPSTKEFRILLLDDEEQNLRILEDSLSRHFEVVAWSNPIEAFENILNNPTQVLHVLIVDQRMPKMTGVEFLQQTLKLFPKAVRIILSGYADIEAVVNGINQAKIFKFLSKPCDQDFLLETVMGAIDSFKLERQNQLLVEELKFLNGNLERVVQERTQQLEQQISLLSVGMAKLEEIHQVKTQVLEKISRMDEVHLQQVKHLLQNIADKNEATTKELALLTLEEINLLEESLKPIIHLHKTEKKVQAGTVLIVEHNKKSQIVAKLALGGSGVEILIADDVDSANAILQSNKVDILCVDQDFLPLAQQVLKQHPRVQVILLTSCAPQHYVGYLKDYPFLNNIIVKDEEHRNLTLKNLHTTVTKLLNGDYFGIEKYLNWGADIKSVSITSSEHRGDYLHELEAYLSDIGVRQTIVRKAVLVAEEMLMNAIYDAPVDPQGLPVYNHLSRTVAVNLKPHEFAKLSYSCDGAIVGISVEDPFGRFEKQILLDYLHNSYFGNGGQLDPNKGGAGRGLHQILANSDLFAVNVRKRLRTEVVALFSLEMSNSKLLRIPSFHYFSVK